MLPRPQLPTASDGTTPAQASRKGRGLDAAPLVTSWFKFPVNYWEERRMFDLRRLLGESAWWLPARLWSFAVVQGGSADMSVYHPCELAEALRYKGQEDLMAAFTQASYLDGDGQIVGWAELYSLPASRKRSASNAANARWATHAADGCGSNKREEKERGDGHAVRDAMRDASHPPSSNSAFALTEQETAVIARDFRLTPDGVKEAETIFRENKANFPGDPTTMDAFRGWLRTSKAARGIKENHRAPVVAVVVKYDPANDVPEPEGWLADVWDDGELRKMTEGVTEWERIGPKRQIAEAIARRRASAAAAK